MKINAQQDNSSTSADDTPLRVLAIETATYCGGVAILDSQKLLASLHLNTRKTHSERLMVSIHTLLNELSFGLDDLDGIVISRGPGSFTGIRIGMSVAKGLAFAAKKPLVAVSTLEALASRYAPEGFLICPVIDARRQEVFAAIYEKSADSSSLRPKSDEMVLSIERLLSNIKAPAVFSGDGSLKYQSIIRETLGPNGHFAPPTRMLPSAEDVALLGLESLRQGKIADPSLLEPTYLRKSDAERPHR
jgi:tRNA threonylcarbamoyladenosine biosynthesis protein TsaB